MADHIGHSDYVPQPHEAMPLYILEVYLGEGKEHIYIHHSMTPFGAFGVGHQYRLMGPNGGRFVITEILHDVFTMDSSRTVHQIMMWVKPLATE